MRLSPRLLIPLLLAILAPLLFSQEAIPRITTVEPMAGSVGTEVSAAGENLDPEHVAELYLTDGKIDIKVAMASQLKELIKFKVPATVKAGRYRLMVLTKGKVPKLIEQPVRFEVE